MTLQWKLNIEAAVCQRGLICVVWRASSKINFLQQCKPISSYLIESSNCYFGTFAEWIAAAFYLSISILRMTGTNHHVCEDLM